ncbi:MAG TPA: GNAT family N-acetyltransferase [Paracoccaceae bacterium]|nr:GNAT family N-acetyltransferase [Paracoccaceae bacterium]
MKPIRTERLILRNWEARDRDLFREINSDDRVMEFFPFRRDHAQSDAMLDRLRRGIEERGFGFGAVEIAANGSSIGFVGIQPIDFRSPFPQGTVEIGWRIARAFWGHGYATEAAKAWLAFGFEQLGLAEIVSFAVRTNGRSIAVMERLGMRRDPASDFDHAEVPDSHPHLKPHVVYRLSAQDWRAMRQQDLPSRARD